jgi:AcrR family transcriptional regulator
VDSTRQRIIEAALTLISERGLSEVTMIEISRTAGVARQTLYNHYPDIASIVTDAITIHNEAAIAHLEQALAVVATPTDTITQLIRHVAAISAHAGHTLDAHHGLPAALQERLGGFDRALEEHIRLALVHGIESDEFRADLSIETDTVLIGHLLRGLSELVAATPSEAPRIVTETTTTAQAALKATS